MTKPGPLPDPPSPVTGEAVGTRARQFTEPMRELCAGALVGANAVFLLLGLSGLFLVIDRWASDFGLRCAAVFPSFVGPLALGLPMAAVLLATHVAPMVPRSRTIVIAALVEYGVSAFFGFVTFLGAFANDLTSVRATLEGLLGRSVWLALLVVAGVVVVRVWIGVFPARGPRPVAYPGAYAQPAYGRTYPGQPEYPPATYRPGSATPTYPASDEPTSDNEWPLIPPPPVPAPLTFEPDPTMRIAPITLEMSGNGAQGETNSAQQGGDGQPESRTQQISPPISDNGA